MVTVWVLLLMSVYQGEGGPTFLAAYPSQQQCEAALVREATKRAGLSHAEGGYGFYQCTAWKQAKVE